MSNVLILPTVFSWLPSPSALCLQAGVLALPLTPVPNKWWFPWAVTLLGTCEGTTQLRPISAEGQQVALHLLCHSEHPRAGFCSVYEIQVTGDDEGSQDAAEVWQSSSSCLSQAVAQASTPAVGGWHLNCTPLQKKP